MTKNFPRKKPIKKPALKSFNQGEREPKNKVPSNPTGEHKKTPRQNRSSPRSARSAHPDSTDLDITSMEYSDHAPSDARSPDDIPNIDVALIGRTNIGKSTLFNRLTNSRRALVHDQAGVTRDINKRVLAKQYRDESIKARVIIADTPGWEDNPYSLLKQNHKEQRSATMARDIPDHVRHLAAQMSHRALENSAIWVLVLDASTPLTSIDFALIDMVRRGNKPAIVVLNKSDLTTDESLAHAVIDAPLVKLSALHRSNITTLTHTIHHTLATNKITANPIVSRPTPLANSSNKQTDNSATTATVDTLDNVGTIGTRDAIDIKNTPDLMGDLSSVPDDRFSGDGSSHSEHEHEHETVLKQRHPTQSARAHKKSLPLKNLPLKNTDTPDASQHPHRVKLLVVGRPNAGKSTLINALLKDNRLLCSPLAGITRDTLEIHWHDGRFPWTLIDTMGIARRFRSQQDSLGNLAIMHVFNAIRFCDVAVLLTTPQTFLNHGDMHIAMKIIAAGKPLLVVVNKCDTVPQRYRKDLLKHIQSTLDERLSLLSFGNATTATALISARDGLGIGKVLNRARMLYTRSGTHISTAALNRWLHALLEEKPPSGQGLRYPSFHYIVQTDTHPPQFAIVGRRLDVVHEGYQRFLSKQLQVEFKFHGVPIKLSLHERHLPQPHRSLTPRESQDHEDTHTSSKAEASSP